MSSQGHGRPLPKFGEWDVNNPASADGFTVIFAKARDEKKATGSTANVAPAPTQINNRTQHTNRPPENYYEPQQVLICMFLIKNGFVVANSTLLGALHVNNQ
ncbi:hypothetical protein Leryth_013322 [Lithospermum erythrorhizon]|nr:hypothetical protein Leryth_013322 [Lithospermum erythrorhizon]